MTELTRRNAVGLLAGGSVLGSGTLLRGSDAPDAASAVSRPAYAALPAAARAASTAPTPLLPSRTLVARVARCRSWDASVYLVTEAGSGFAALTPAGFAIAAACQAAGRPVAMQFTEHEPLWQDGAGRFHGVALAIDPQDLDGGAAGAAEAVTWS